MLTVLTWFWSQPGGRSEYTAAHVNIWAAMVRRHLTLPHRLACVTDSPAGIDPGVAIIAPPRDLEHVTIPTWGPHRPQCLRRLVMFRGDAAATFGERFVCMDLDCVVAGNLDSLFSGDEDFRMFRGTTPRRPYNGSMMLIRAGARTKVWDNFTPARAAAAGRKFIGSDQAWISDVLGPREATWGPEHGVHWYRDRMAPSAPPRLVFFPGNPKPWLVVDAGLDGFTETHYRAERQPAPALILGHRAHVWADVQVALEGGGRFGAVIASEEAAKHWPGEVFAAARDDRHALRIARMHGFEDVVVCGGAKVPTPQGEGDREAVEGASSTASRTAVEPTF